MTDLTTERLTILRKHRLPGINLGENGIHPNYDGNSILSIPSSICRLLDAPEIGHPSLNQSLLDPLGSKINRIILVLVDSLALHRLKRWMADGTAPVWQKLEQAGFLAPLTSITPSTTSAAITTLWTGRNSYEHGVMGYEMWMKEYGMIVNMINHTPVSLSGSGSLDRAGFQANSYLPFPTMGTHLEKFGIETHAFLHYTIIGSGLSQMTLRGAKVHAYGTATDLWVNVRNVLEAQQDQRIYNWVYWGNLDHHGHINGPDSEYAVADFAAFSQAFEDHFFNKLALNLKKGTLIVLLADHGMLFTERDNFFDLRSHPGLDRRLHMQPSGENRLMYLYVRPGQIEAVREYFDRTWMGGFNVLDSVYAVEKGFFGRGNRHPALLERVGDLLVIPKNNMYLWWGSKDNPMLGRHGGLHEEEMVVPFLAARLD